jgi:hypothetical protein
MLVETSQMQRLIVVLGHPTYGLTVVLFSLLLSSGIGSALTSRIAPDAVGSAGVVRMTGLLGLLVVFRHHHAAADPSDRGSGHAGPDRGLGRPPGGARPVHGHGLPAGPGPGPEPPRA